MQEVETYKFPPKEETLFSISGRGHLENPTSDLLCFFMQPKRQHGFDTCFLRAFLGCMEKDYGAGFWKTLSFDPIRVQTQVRTNDNKWIDLLITGPDWVLVIENKLHAPLGNPLPSYVEHAGRFAANRRFFALLSPQRINAPDWASVTYRKYCDALKSTLAPEVFTGWSSKWQVYAKEFIVHLENELYGPIMKMTPEQRAFVEGNLRTIEDIKKLSQRYMADLLSELTSRLRCEVPGRSFQFWDGHWALLCDEVATERVQLRFYFATPYHKNDWPADDNFRIGFDVFGQEETQKFDELGITIRPTNYGLHCHCEDDFRRSDDAMTKFCSLAKQVLALFGE